MRLYAWGCPRCCYVDLEIGTPGNDPDLCVCQRCGWDGDAWGDGWVLMALITA